jgi:hypothetical protein
VQRPDHRTFIFVQHPDHRTFIFAQSSDHPITMLVQSQDLPITMLVKISDHPIAMLVQSSDHPIVRLVQSSDHPIVMLVQSSDHPIIIWCSVQTIPLPYWCKVQTTPLPCWRRVQTTPLPCSCSIQTTPLPCSCSVQIIWIAWESFWIEQKWKCGKGTHKYKDMLLSLLLTKTLRTYIRSDRQSWKSQEVHASNIMHQYFMRIGNGYIWLGTTSSGVLTWTPQKMFGFHKRRGNSYLAERLLASQFLHGVISFSNLSILSLFNDAVSAV